MKDRTAEQHLRAAAAPFNIIIHAPKCDIANGNRSQLAVLNVF